MIVVDANVVVNALSDDLEPGRAARERLKRERHLAAPHLLDLEVTAVLRRQTAQGLLSVQRARAALDDLADLHVDRWDHGGLIRRIWSLRDTLSVYDASYVALAEELGCPLVTGDARLAKGAEHAKSAAHVEVLTVC